MARCQQPRGFDHPRTFSRADLDDVFASGADFVRKFDESCYPGVIATSLKPPALSAPGY